MQVVAAFGLHALLWLAYVLHVSFRWEYFLQYVYLSLEMLLIAGLMKNADVMLTCRLEINCSCMILERGRWLHLCLTMDGFSGDFMLEHLMSLLLKYSVRIWVLVGLLA